MFLSVLSSASASVVMLFGCAGGDAIAAHAAPPQSSAVPACAEAAPVGQGPRAPLLGMLIGTSTCDNAGQIAGYGNRGIVGDSAKLWHNGTIGLIDDNAAAGYSGGPAGPSVPAVTAPKIILNANPAAVQVGSTALLEWTSANVDTCDASDGWSGPVAVSGTQSTGALDKDTTFTLSCSGLHGSVTDSVNVTVTSGPPAPTLALTASPNTVSSGNAATLTWSSTGASACTASDAWSGSVSTAGSETTGALAQTSTFTLTCSGPGGSVSKSTTITVVDGDPNVQASFNQVLIEADQAPWGKNLADIDGDGSLDILEGGGALGQDVYWYRYPTWDKFRIGTQSGGDDLQTADINNDGALDVAVNGMPIAWYENPRGNGGNAESQWARHIVADLRAHDIAIADFDGNGKADIAVRIANYYQSTRLFLQLENNSWRHVNLFNALQGSGGLAVDDIDDDGFIDVIGDGYWLRNPTANFDDGDAWLRYTIGSWPAGSSIDSADINMDGNVDVTLAVSEVGPGDLTWFEAPDDPLTQSWIRHDIGIVEDVHRHHVVDINNDGDLDIVFAEMHQGAFDRVAIYNNEGDAANWTLQVLAEHASHNIAVGDIENDGDLDIVGANWQLQAPAGGDLFLWLNEINDSSGNSAELD